MNRWDAEGFRARMRAECRRAEDRADKEARLIRTQPERGSRAMQLGDEGEASLYRQVSELAVSDSPYSLIALMDEVIARPDRLTDRDRPKPYEDGLVRAAKDVRKEAKQFLKRSGG